MKLSNKVAIVTGGAGGIGRAICLDLAREGSNIVVADIRLVPARRVVDEVCALGRKAISVESDVTHNEDAVKMAKSALDNFGAIDILINCAGGNMALKTFNQYDEKDWDNVIELNLKGTFTCTRAVINHMIERKTGKIINISSGAGINGIIGGVAYSAAKAGVIGFTMALAKEVASYGINVNCVSPGPILTGHVLTFPEKIRRESELSTGMGRLGTPEEIAALVTFLATEDASFMTGQNFPILGLMNLGVGVTYLQHLGEYQEATGKVFPRSEK
jgi:NAD(P)-dependent dehydrogenase (short-subunit alcohol dehydrogenase family)